MKKLLFSALLATGITAFAQPATGNFTSISASGEVNVILSKGDSCSVRVECEDKEDLGKIKTSVSNGQLIVTGKAGNEEKCKVFVSYRELK